MSFNHKSSSVSRCLLITKALVLADVF